MKKQKIKLSELEKKLILDSLNASSYLGSHSDLVSKIRKKMKPQEPPKPEEPQKKPTE